MRHALTDKAIIGLKTVGTIPDPGCRGLYVRITPAGVKSFAVVCRNPYGKQIWRTLGSADRLKITDARTQALAMIARIRAGEPADGPLAPLAGTFGDIFDRWLKRQRERGVRAVGEYERLARKHVLPLWGDIGIDKVRRAEVIALLDRVADEHGDRVADAVLAVVSMVTRWHESRTDGYASPVRNGMRRVSMIEASRDRILADAEIVALWHACVARGDAYGDLVRMLLLTGARRDKIASMAFSDIDDDGVWQMPREAREKPNAGKVPLPKLALDIIRARPAFGDSDLVFTPTGKPLNNWNRDKVALDAALGFAEPWVLHDLRRTCRSLMSRCGVPSHIAERALGHIVGGKIERIYDRHDYQAEVGAALAKVATLIKNLLNPKANVVPLSRRVKRG